MNENRKHGVGNVVRLIEVLPSVHRALGPSATQD